MKPLLYVGQSPIRPVQIRESIKWAPDEPALEYRQAYPMHGSEFTVGRHRACDVVLDDRYVSRVALQFLRQEDGWRVNYLNKHRVEHRRWAQQAQAPSEPGTSESLEVGEHAFLINGGEARDLMFCLLVSVDEAGPGADPQVAPDASPGGLDASQNTPQYTATSLIFGENSLERFCDAYHQFLTWPPFRRPRVIPDPEIKRRTNKDPAYAIAKVIDYAVSIGYAVGEAPTAREPDLPFFLARNRVLTFEEHARWRRELSQW